MPSRSRAALLAAAALYAVTARIAAQRGGPNIGQPLDGLTPSLTAAFNAGARTFAKRYEIADGLGPVFNDESCSDSTARRSSAARAIASSRASAASTTAASIRSSTWADR